MSRGGGDDVLICEGENVVVSQFLDTMYISTLFKNVYPPPPRKKHKINSDILPVAVVGPARTVEGPASTVEGPVPTIEGPVPTVEGPVPTVEGLSLIHI